MIRRRRPWGRLLTWKGDPRMAAATAAYLSPADCEAVRPMVEAAVKRFDAITDNLFNVDSFGWAVRDAYGLERFPTPSWCEDVLAALPYVAKVQGYRLWRYTD